MFILKYKDGNDTFYRVSKSRQPSGKSIQFDKPLVAHSVTTTIQQFLEKIDSVLNEKEVESPKEQKKKAFVSSVLKRYSESLSQE